MSAQWWIVIVVVLVVVAVIAYVRFSGAQDRGAQDRRMTDLRQGGAQSPAEQISQREDRRLAGMTAEDREWETASLQRNRERQEGSHES